MFAADGSKVKTCAERTTLMRNHQNEADKVKEVVEMMHHETYHWRLLISASV